MIMDEQQILDKINSWTGCNKEYWLAIDLLKSTNRVSDKIISRLNEGVDCYTEALVNYEMSNLRKELEVSIKKQHSKIKNQTRSKSSEKKETSSTNETVVNDK